MPGNEQLQFSPPPTRRGICVVKLVRKLEVVTFFKISSTYLNQFQLHTFGGDDLRRTKPNSWWG